MCLQSCFFRLFVNPGNPKISLSELKFFHVVGDALYPAFFSGHVKEILRDLAFRSRSVKNAQSAFSV